MGCTSIGCCYQAVSQVEYCERVSLSDGFRALALCDKTVTDESVPVFWQETVISAVRKCGRSRDFWTRVEIDSKLYLFLRDFIECVLLSDLLSRIGALKLPH